MKSFKLSKPTRVPNSNKIFGNNALLGTVLLGGPIAFFLAIWFNFFRLSKMNYFKAKGVSSSTYIALGLLPAIVWLSFMTSFVKLNPDATSASYFTLSLALIAVSTVITSFYFRKSNRDWEQQGGAFFTGLGTVCLMLLGITLTFGLAHVVTFPATNIVVSEEDRAAHLQKFGQLEGLETEIVQATLEFATQPVPIPEGEARVITDPIYKDIRTIQFIVSELLEDEWIGEARTEYLMEYKNYIEIRSSYLDAVFRYQTFPDPIYEERVIKIVDELEASLNRLAEIDRSLQAE